MPRWATNAELSNIIAARMLPDLAISPTDLHLELLAWSLLLHKFNEIILKIIGECSADEIPCFNKAIHAL